MKNVVIILVGLLSASFMQAQTKWCDIQAVARGFSSSDLEVGQHTDYSFTLLNDAKGTACYYDVKSVQVVLSLPSNGLAFQSILSPAEGKGDYFTWTYSPEANALIGINHTPIGHAQAEQVSVRLEATPMPQYGIQRSVVLNVMQNPNGPIFYTNNPLNDNSSSVLTIRAAKPRDLSNFSIAGSCNVVTMQWDDEFAYGRDFIEILRSGNGRDFYLVGKVEISKGQSAQAYVYKDEKNLEPGITYTYRLRTVAKDGTGDVVREVRIKNECTVRDIELEIFPNPATDKTYVRIKGMSQSENPVLVITNAAGEKILSIPNASVNEPNEVRLGNMTPGIYNVSLSGKEEIISKRFIRID